MEFSASNSVGASGGLLILWKKSFFTIHNVIAQRSYIVLQGRVGDFECNLVNVYAPNETAQRRIIWGELIAIKSTFQEPWCLGGDFNEIEAISERVGCVRMDRGMRDFLEFCNTMELQDIPMLGRKFT